MNTRVFHSALYLLIAISLQAQDISWIKSFQGFGGSARGEGIATDESGGVFVAGLFDGSVDFDPNEAESILTSLGSNDIYLVSLDSDGELVGNIHIASMSNTSIGNFSREEDHLWLSGATSGDMEIRLPDTTYLYSSSNNASFMAKIDDLGNLIWIYRPSEGGGNVATDSHIHSDGSIYLAVNFSEQVLFDPDSTMAMATSNGSSDVALIKLNGNGEFIWMRHFGSTGIDQSWDIDSDSSGVYINLTYFAALDADPGIGEEILSHDPVVGFDAAVIKLDHAGSFQWVQAYETAETDFSRTDVQEDGQLLISAGGFIGVFTPEGEFIDTLRYLPGGFPRVDSEGFPIRAGSFRGEVDFDPTEEELLVTSGTSEVNGDFSSDLYAIRYNQDFTPQWLVTLSSQEQLLSRGASFATPGATYLYSEHFHNMIVTSNGTVVDTVVGTGSNNAFVVKIVNSTMTTSVNDYTYERLEIWPQPAQDRLHFEVPTEVVAQSIEIISLNGKVLQLGDIKTNTIDIQYLRTGIYLLRLTDGKTVYQSLFIKSE